MRRHTGLITGLMATVAVGCAPVTLQTTTSPLPIAGEVIDSDVDARKIQFRFSNGTERWIAVDEIAEVEPLSTTQTVLGIAAVVGGTLILVNADSPEDIFGGGSALGLAAIAGGFIYLGSGFQAGAARSHLERAGWQKP